MNSHHSQTERKKLFKSQMIKFKVYFTNTILIIYVIYLFIIHISNLSVHLIVELYQVLNLNDNKAFWLGIPAIFLHKYMYQYNITLT